MEIIRDNMVYARKSELGYLLGLYYLVFWKGYLKDKNIWKPYSAIQQLKKIISLFYKNHPNKPITTSKAIDIVLLIAGLTISLIIELTKQKQGRLTKNTSKHAKKN